MKNIDFLPSSYRERNALRHARTWWCIVMLVFGTVILSTAMLQLTWRRGVERQLDLIAPKFAAAKVRDQELARLQKQIQASSEAAALYTYLKHPWPRTQILSSVMASLPQSVRLEEVHLGEMALPAPQEAEPTSGKRRTKKQAEAKKESPSQQDLGQLRLECDGKQTVVDIVGTASDVQQLHTYVEQLGTAPLVETAQLKSLETIIDKGNANSGPEAVQTRFILHLKIRPGYGQAGGPQPKGPAHAGTTAAAIGIEHGMTGELR